MNRHTRSGSAGLDRKAFREAIARMRQEVLESRAETQQAKDQLNCLILLIKRSWKGDKAACMHVSNIVGIPPPKSLLEDPSTGENETHYTGKSRAINHWAMLSLGLLNHHYKELEVHALARAKARLEQRQGYLEEQLAYHRDLLLAQPIRALMTSEDQHFFLTEQSKRQMNGKLPRPASVKDDQKKSPNGMLDIILDSNSRPKTFCKPELFDAGVVLGDRSKYKRPMSCQQQKKADIIRSRPASAGKVVTKGDRPLKFETTRPISTNDCSVKGQRATSAKVRGYDPDNTKQPKAYTHINSTMSKVKLDAKNLRHKDSISEDLRKMERMEEEFTKTTKLLQDKLGIYGDGVI